MSEGHVQVPPDSTGKKMRCIQRTIDGNNVYEEVTVPLSVDGAVGLGEIYAKRNYYDRNALSKPQRWAGSVSAHSWTERWRYTVPTGKKMFHTFFCLGSITAIATSGKYTAVSTEYYSVDAGLVTEIALSCHYETNVPRKYLSEVASVFAVADDYFRGLSYSDDTINHTLVITSQFVEFDA